MPQAKKKNSVGRAFLASILIIIGAVLAPVSVVAHWATSQVTSTQQFVDTLAPLAENPEVQDVIITQVTKAIDDNINIEEQTGNLLEGLGTALNLPDVAKQALGLVKDPIASGVKGLIHNVVSDIVRSPEFATAWRKTIEVTHSQLIALLEGDPNSTLQIENDGTLKLQIKPLIAQVKTTLVNQGMGFAQAIPEIDGSITIAKIPELATARVIYQVGVGVGAWLPWISAFLIALGGIVAVRRPRATLTIGIVLAIEMAALAILFAFGDVVVSAVADPTISQAASAIYTSVVDYVIATFIALTVLGAIIALAGWSFGESNPATQMRAWISKQFNALRSVIAPKSSGFNATSDVLHRIRIFVRTIIVVGFAVWYGLAEPLTVGSTIGFTIATLAVLFVYEILQRKVVGSAATTRATATKQAPTATARTTVPQKTAVAKPSASKTAAKKPAANKASTPAKTSTKPRSSSR